MHDRYAYISNFVSHSTDALQQTSYGIKGGQNLGIYNEVGKGVSKKIEFLLDNENLLQKFHQK